MTREEAIQAAARHVADDLARQAARSPRDAAVASLGPDATEREITDWIARYRPDSAAANTA